MSEELAKYLSKAGRIQLNQISEEFELETIDRIQTEVFQRYQKTKDEIILKKLQEKGFDSLLDRPSSSRFKRLIVEVSGSTERIYADDGTDNGVLIVGFKRSCTHERKGDKIEFTHTYEVFENE